MSPLTQTWRRFHVKNAPLGKKPKDFRVDLREMNNFQCWSDPFLPTEKTWVFFAFFRRFFLWRPRLNAGVPAFKREACLVATA